MSLLDKKPINLTKDLKYPTFNELHDSPSLPSSYGSAGFTTDGKFLVYDAYDIWALDPSGKSAPRSVTEEAGRRDQLRFRYVRVDPQEDAIRTDAPILLSAFQTWTKAEGFYQDQLNGSAEPKRSGSSMRPGPGSMPSPHMARTEPLHIPRITTALVSSRLCSITLSTGLTFLESLRWLGWSSYVGRARVQR